MPHGRAGRVIPVLVVALGVAAVCVRLGIWQVSRLGERRAHNTVLTSRLGERALAAASLPADTGAGHYRLATLRGVAVYGREIVWAPRMRRSSPGVNFFTPVRVAGSDTMIIVNRGWAYSPDAKSAELARWREGETLSVSGYLETWMHDCGATATTLPASCGDTAARAVRRLDRRAAERLVGAPLGPYILMQTSDSALRADSVPARVELPVLDEGPHRTYAFQWFGFAMVAIVGGIALARKR